MEIEIEIDEIPDLPACPLSSLYQFVNPQSLQFHVEANKQKQQKLNLSTVFYS